MDAHINNRETFLTDAQFLNRLSKRVRLRFVVEINGDLAAIETGHEVVFLFSSFFPFPIFSFSFSFALVRAFFFSFFFACSQRVPHSRLLPVRLSTLHEIPGVSSPRRERFHLSRNEFLVIYSFFFFFFARQAAQLRDTKRRTRPFCFPNRPFAFFSIGFRRASRRSLWRETCASSPIRFYRNGFEIFIDIKSIENITPLKINPFCPIFINLY